MTPRGPRWVLAAVLAGSLFAVVSDGNAQTCFGPPPVPPNAAASVTAPGSSIRPATVTVSWIGVPTTGASAARSYVIQVGTAPGRTDVAAIDTGTATAVTSEQKANNGTYYVRVRAVNACGISGPSPEPVVTVSGGIPSGEPGAAATINSGRYGRDALGNVFVAAEVRGAWGSRAAAFVRLDARFVGVAGDTVGTDFGYVNGRSRRLILSRIVDDSTVAGGENSCVYISTGIPYARVAQVSVATSWSASQLETLRGSVSTQSVQQNADVFGDLRVSGQSTNAGLNTTYFNQVLIAARGTGDAVIDCDYTYVDGASIRLPSGVVSTSGLFPGQVASFVNYGRPSFAEVRRIETWTAWDEADAGPTASTSTQLSWRWLAGPSIEEATTQGERALLRRAAIDRLRRLDDAANQTVR